MAFLSLTVIKSASEFTVSFKELEDIWRQLLQLEIYKTKKAVTI